MATAKRKTRKTPTAAQIEARKQRAAELHETLIGQVEALTSTEEWMRFLATATKFHNYSFGNIMLIMAQRPAATAVAGYKSWKDKGRQVRKGERAIWINGFAVKKVTETDKTTGEDTEKTITYFPSVKVFDAAQTDPIEGKEHLDPTTVTVAHRLAGEDSTDIYRRTEDFLIRSGWSVTREDIDGEVNGKTLMDGSHRVVVAAGLSEAMAAKTLLHEAAHVLLHTANGQRSDSLNHRGIGEIEAESVAHIVAGLLGLDTSDYSVGYVAGWGGGNVDTIRATGERVLTAVNTLADGVQNDQTETAAVA